MNYCKKKKKSNSDLEESLSISENNMILLTEKKKKVKYFGLHQKKWIIKWETTDNPEVNKRTR